jgi:hypothetical protein
MNPLGKKSLIACAVASALGTSAAFALPPTAVPDFTLYAAGGSAQANAFYVATSKILTNVDSYTDATGGADSGSYRVLFGSVGTAFTFNGVTIPAGKNVLYFYKFNGGSFTNGLAPQVGSGSTLPYPTTASVLSATAISGATAGTGKPTFAYVDTGALTNNQIPDWGVTDVETTIFTGINNPATGGAPPSVGAADGIYDNLFGVAVTDNVFTATHAKTNFSSAEVEGILAGTLSDWGQLFADDGTQLAAGGIILLDRGVGSGTKAAGNQYFLGFPGDGSAAQVPGSVAFGYTGTTIALSQSSQDVNEGSTGAVVTDLLAAQANGLRAVAILGLENPPALHQVGSPAKNQYDFTKLNGVAVDTATSGDDINGTVATSYINVIKGNYDFYFQNSFNTRASTLGGTTTGDIFANQFKTIFTSSTFVGAAAGTAFPSSVPGTLLDADKVSTLAAGVTINTRNKVSTAPLQNKFHATAAGIPVSKETL